MEKKQEKHGRRPQAEKTGSLANDVSDSLIMSSSPSTKDEFERGRTKKLAFTGISLIEKVRCGKGAQRVKIL